MPKNAQFFFFKISKINDNGKKKALMEKGFFLLFWGQARYA